MRILVLVAAVLSCPAAALAQQTTKVPEALLPADCAVFFRYDGYEPHKNAYDQTALAKAMKDDLGEFLEYLAGFVKDALIKQYMGDADEQVQKLGLAHFSQFLEYYWKHGVVVGFQTPGHVAPAFTRWQLTFVFPEAGTKKNREALAPLLELAARIKGAPVHESKRGKRLIREFVSRDFALAWWIEGEHLVFTLGTDGHEPLLEVADGKAANLTANPSWKALTAFKNYETDMRGFVDLKQAVALLAAPAEINKKLHMAMEAMAHKLTVDQFGLAGLGSLSFHLGFEGKYQRSTIAVEVPQPKERKGLLRLISAPIEFEPKGLPALPPDAASVSVRHVDWETVYEVIGQGVRFFMTGNALREGRLPGRDIPDVDALLGLDFRKEFLGSLDTTIVLFNALSEGPSLLGQGIAIKLKDGKQLQACLDKLMAKLQEHGDEWRFTFQKKSYRGGHLNVLTAPGPGAMSLPLTYTIHKDWLVVSLFPAPVKGYILRSEGKYRAWKAPPLVQAAIAQGRKAGNAQTKLAAVTVTDPIPTVEVGLALLPGFVAMANIGLRGVLPGGFDTTKIPNAQAVTEHLFPDVTLFFDDGNALRWENHYAIDIPDWMGFGLFPLWSLGSVFVL